MPRNELEVHAAIPSEQDIEVMMCRCKDMEVKSQKLQRFSISNCVNFEEKDIILHIMVVEKTKMVSEVQV